MSGIMNRLCRLCAGCTTDDCICWRGGETEYAVRGTLTALTALGIPVETLEKIASGEMIRSCPDDIRASGWSVAVHNDYRQNGQAYTFWLFTKDGRAVKGRATPTRKHWMGSAP